MTVFARGRRMLSTASIGIIVVAILHTIGNTLPDPPTDAAYLLMEGAMRGYRIPLGMGMSPSVWDVYMCLVFTMSITFVAMGAFGLVVSGSRDATPRLLTLTALVGALFSAALTALAGYYRIPPPLTTMAIVTLLYVVAVRTSH